MKYRVEFVLAITCLALCANAADKATPPRNRAEARDAAASSHTSPDDAPDQAALDFFEKKIRPVLVTHCYECHAAETKNLKGGLLVDSRAGLLSGGDSGPAVVPRDVDNSLLIDALRYDSFEMPPKGKLPDAVIADFERWVRTGAADPRIAHGKSNAVRKIDIEAGRSHWAYQPVTEPTVPAVQRQDWPVNDLDHFVLSRLEASQLSPSAEASRVALVRRLYFSLLGLPPTPEQQQQFVNDTSPQAYERLVDQLLESPRFGERWGRHWLDVVRFAESVTLRGLVLPEAWRYRDYVIDAFNDDRPFDRFLTEQLAGDLLDDSSLEVRRRNIIATTFLTMGNSNLEDQDKNKLEMDYVDEQLDVIGRGLLAQTVTCARCHDHKFDPIPTGDYYALAGVLKGIQALKHANVSRWVEVPLPVTDEQQKQLDQHRQQVAQLEKSVAELKKRVGPTQAQAGNIVAVKDLPGIVVDDTRAKKVGVWQDSQYVKSFVGNGYCHDQAEKKGEKTISFIPELPHDGRYEVRFSYSHSSNRPPDLPITVFSADGEKVIHIDERKRPPIDGLFISLGVYRFETAGQSYVFVSNEGTTGSVIADAVQFIPVNADGTPQVAPSDKAAAITKSKATRNTEIQELQELKKQLRSQESALAKLRKSAPPSPMAISILEGESGVDLPIHIRGNVHNLGDIVPRGVLQVATYGKPPKMPKDGSGRLELARWMVDPQHPLTSRVLVNRVWHWLFGSGLVRTVDNFGTTGEPPSHPRLLDYLASQFVQDGWSVKRLIRTIVLSRTYRMAAANVSPATDPENRLLSHMTRQRLDAEALRDAMLCVAGTLDLTMGGRTFPQKLSSDYGFAFDQPRRSVYAPVFRNSLPEIFEAFDFANPSMVTGRRNESTVAPQALFLMNHPFVREQSEQAATKLLAALPDDQEARIQHAYLTTLTRRATAAELALSQTFLKSAAADSNQHEAWTQFVQSLFASIEFRYLR